MCGCICRYLFDFLYDVGVMSVCMCVVVARYKMEFHFLIYIRLPIIMVNHRENFSYWLTSLHICILAEACISIHFHVNKASICSKGTMHIKLRFS